jgi:hypothetical protein
MYIRNLGFKDVLHEQLKMKDLLYAYLKSAPKMVKLLSSYIFEPEI